MRKGRSDLLMCQTAATLIDVHFVLPEVSVAGIGNRVSLILIFDYILVTWILLFLQSNLLKFEKLGDESSFH